VIFENRGIYGGVEKNRTTRTTGQQKIKTNSSSFYSIV